MSTAIAFLSGKGGSGKTTLALSMANLLCRCEVHTLLVDCDLSTNGATYFYESQLNDQQNGEQSNLFSFNDLLNKCNNFDELSLIKIRSNLDFIPSISEISDQYISEKAAWNSRDQESQLREFLNWAQFRYDVILFDCQAGYTEFFPVLLPMMDVILFILEADSISGSAMRSLHLKTGRFLGHARLYQIFNKATPEEFEIYSKIVGTFFTNIGTLLFDWKIRQAFSRSQIPDLESTSAKYSSDLCDICKIILSEKDIQKRLEHFSAQLHFKELDEEREQTNLKLYKFMNKSRLLKISSLIVSFLTVIGIFLTILLELKNNIVSTNDNLILVIIFAMLIVTFSITTNIFIDYSHENRKERQKLEYKLKNLDKELAKLEKSFRDDVI